jgi:hypothetical protein
MSAVPMCGCRRLTDCCAASDLTSLCLCCYIACFSLQEVGEALASISPGGSLQQWGSDRRSNGREYITTQVRAHACRHLPACLQDAQACRQACFFWLTKGVWLKLLHACCYACMYKAGRCEQRHLGGTHEILCVTATGVQYYLATFDGNARRLGRPCLTKGAACVVDGQAPTLQP